ncbi:MAG: DUF86 domain-containing protein [Lachnospiraceae bacterium]|nr:DUF86 domain-containing protein [Lachnospiraceae bacterium]
MEHRDYTIIQKIILYCDRIENYLSENQISYDVFLKNPMYQDACCMCIVQIGELAGLLSDEIKSAYKNIPWRVIKDTRNFYVHAYGSIDLSAVWSTLTHDIPPLRESCVGIIKNADSEKNVME